MKANTRYLRMSGGYSFTTETGSVYEEHKMEILAVISDFGGVTGSVSGQLCSGYVRRQREQRAVGLIR